MNNEIISINDQSLTVKEYNNQRVITFKDIDRVHERPEGTASRNYRENRRRLIAGVDYYQVEVTGDEFRRQFGIAKNAGNKITFITESGYLMLVKSFTDDLAWSVQRQLVKSYFKVRQVSTENIQTESLASVNGAVRIMTKLLEAAGYSQNDQLITAKTFYEKAGVSIPVYFRQQDIAGRITGNGPEDMTAIKNLCQESMLLSDGEFNVFISGLKKSSNPVILQACIFLMQSRQQLKDNHH